MTNSLDGAKIIATYFLLEIIIFEYIFKELYALLLTTQKQGSTQWFRYFVVVFISVGGHGGVFFHLMAVVLYESARPVAKLKTLLIKLLM